MKKLFAVMLLACFCTCAFAQDNSKNERVSPTFGVKIERECYFVSLEKDGYNNVTVELDAAELGDLFKEGVKVTVRDKDGKKIYKKRFSKSYLYAFSSGLIQVGKGDALTQVTIYKSTSGDWIAVIKEKGIY